MGNTISEIVAPLSDKERNSNFLTNGGLLLKDLVAFSNGRDHDTHIRNFSFKEVTREMTHAYFFSYIFCKGYLEGRDFLVKGFWGFLGNDCTPRDIAVASLMSRHKNALKLIGSCLEFWHPVAVYENVGSADTLEDVIFHASEDRNLSLSRRVKIARDIASVVPYLHTNFPTPIIHRNIHPSVFIIDSHGVPKLFDFTSCIPLPPGKDKVKAEETVGEFGFLDPQYLASNIVTQKSDVYSFGKLLLFIVTGGWRNVDEIDNLDDCLRRARGGERLINEIVDPKILEKGMSVEMEQILDALIHLIQTCTQDRGDNRPDMADVARELHRIERELRSSNSAL